MAALASFYLVSTSELEGLLQHAEITVKKNLFSKKIIDNYWDYLSSNAQSLEGLSGGGFIYGNLFVSLEEKKNINLLENEYEHFLNEITEKRDGSHFIFTLKQKQLLFAQLEPKFFPLKEVSVFNEEFSEEGDDDTARLTIEALELLRSNWDKVNDETTVLYLTIG